MADPNTKLAELLHLDSGDYRWERQFLGNCYHSFLLRIAKAITAACTAMDEERLNEDDDEEDKDEEQEDDDSEGEHVWEIPEENDEDWEAEMFGLPLFDDIFLDSELD